MTDEQRIKQLEKTAEELRLQNVDLQLRTKRLETTLKTYFESQAKRARSNGRRQANISQIEVAQADFFDNLGNGLEVSG